MFEKIENHNFIKHIYALLVVNFGWVLFRSPNLKEAYNYFKAMLGGNGVIWSDYTYMFLKEYWVSLYLHLFLVCLLQRKSISLLLNKLNIV